MNYKKTIVIGSLIVGIVVLFEGNVVNALLGLILVGTIPGTAYTLPFWAMMALYCTIISLLITWYTESLIISRRTRKSTNKQRVSHRGYSHI